MGVALVHNRGNRFSIREVSMFLLRQFFAPLALIATLGALPCAAQSSSLGFPVAGFETRERNAKVYLAVERTGGTAGTVSVAYATSDGTALAGSDYVARSGTLTWYDGEPGPKYIDITLLRSAITEPSEFFTIALSAPTGGATVGTDGLFQTASVSILDVPALARGDTNYDGKSDLFWRSNAPGTGLSWWTMNGNQVTASNYFDVNADWQIADVGDRSGDGRADILWRRTTDGATYSWTLEGLAMIGSNDLGVVGLDWTIAGTADLDGDGMADILWRRNTGEVYLWLAFDDDPVLYSSGARNLVYNRQSLGIVDNAWQIADLADFDGDGRTDVLFRNTTTGQAYIWLMNGFTITSQGNAAPGVIPYPMSWTLVGASDFDGDGRADLLWRDPGGGLWLWFMNGTTLAYTASIGTPAAGYEIASLADLNGDGKTDIVLRHPSGILYVYFMNGGTIASGGTIPDPGLAWRLVAP
jgi:Calx-beta domain/FG-GAP-like repeat